MLLDNQHPLNKSIMASCLGLPNVGKSSLVNYLLGFDLSAVTSKAQTTRNRFHCIFTVDRTEIILLDTPGIHQASQEINKRMNQEAIDAGDEADVNLLLIDLTKNLQQQFLFFKSKFEQSPLKRLWIIFTKSDLIPQITESHLRELFLLFREQWPVIERYFVLSSKTGDGVHLLTGALCDSAPFGPHHYQDDSLSNKNERFFVTEYIREQAFELLKEELPYELAVIIEDFKDLRDKPQLGKDDDNRVLANISATILVNRPSQRAIVVGSKGAMIKEIGVRARQKIEGMVGGKVFLNLHVKVTPKWFRNNLILEQIGLPRAVDSKRVWRSRS